MLTEICKNMASQSEATSNCTRERRRAAYRNLVDQHQVQIEEITRLEAIVAALIHILEAAGFEIPDVVSEKLGDKGSNDGRRLLAELETYVDESL